jgi:hypothetical protein
MMEEIIYPRSPEERTEANLETLNLLAQMDQTGLIPSGHKIQDEFLSFRGDYDEFMQPKAEGQEFYSAAAKASSMAKLFFTSTGLLGNRPYRMSVGDTIWIFPGL